MNEAAPPHDHDAASPPPPVRARRRHGGRRPGLARPIGPARWPPPSPARLAPPFFGGFPSPGDGEPPKNEIGVPRSGRMKVGLFVPLGNGNASAELLRTLGGEAEDRGFESIWVAEHVVMFDEYESQYPYADDGRFPGGGDSGLLEPLTALTYLAAVTDRVRLGTGICLVPQRNPVYTAKQVVDLDVLSGGRVDFGIGVGWLREEFEARRGALRAAGRSAPTSTSQVMQALWTDDPSEFHGELYDLPPVPPCTRSRCRQPHPPIHVGGESDAALRRVARLGQGWYSFNRMPERPRRAARRASTRSSPPRAAPRPTSS